MKRVFGVFLIIISIIVLTGCTKNYKAITYTNFIEFFNKKANFIVDNQTLKYEDKFERFIEVSGENTEFTYIEFKSEEAARKYMIDNYQSLKEYKLKDKEKYMTVEYKINKYMRIIQIDKIVIYGQTPVASNKKEVKKIFKELGY